MVHPMAKTKSCQSAAKVFSVLDVLFRDFQHGYTSGDLVKATQLSGPDITRFVNTLLEAGYAERIQETGRIRVSVSAARKSMQVMQSLDSAEHRIKETRGRLFTID